MRKFQLKDRESIRLFDRRYAREVSRRRRFVKLGERSYSTFYRRPINISRLFGRRSVEKAACAASCLRRASSNLSSWQTWAAPATFRKPSITRPTFTNLLLIYASELIIYVFLRRLNTRASVSPRIRSRTTRLV